MIKEELTNILQAKGWNISEISIQTENAGSGLLNKPVLKCRVKHDNKTEKLAVKISDREPLLLFRQLYQQYGFADAKQLETFDRCCHFLSMKNMPEREFAFYQNYNNAIASYIPRVFGMSLCNNRRILIMEDLSYCDCMDQVRHPESWRQEDIILAVEALAFFHHIELCPFSEYALWDVPDNQWEVAGFLEELDDSMTRYAGLKRSGQSASKEYIRHLEEYESRLSQYRKILIHNDFNIRNICVDRSAKQLKVYDWEFIDYKNPIMDIVDLLSSLSTECLEKDFLDALLLVYINKSHQYGEADLESGALKEQLYYNVLKFLATRMNMYLLFYAFQKNPYMVRMYRNLFLLLDYCKTGYM